jgi:hypothetical protein
MSAFLQSLFANTCAVSALEEWTPEAMSEAANRYEAAFAPLAEHALTAEDRGWLEDSLRGGGDRGYFAVEVIRRKDALEDGMFALFIRAAVEEIDPSANRTYVEPLVARFGLRRVIEALLEIFERGGPADKAGAMNALYWAQAPLTFVGNGPFTLENATPESRALYLAVEDLRKRRDALFLRAFVTETDSSLRRCLLPRLSLDPRDYAAELAPLVETAQGLARALK